MLAIARSPSGTGAENDSVPTRTSPAFLRGGRRLTAALSAA
jgi:hypothetical protein